MKTSFIKKIAVIVCFVVAIALVSSFSYAASSISIAAGSTSLTVGSSTNLTIRANNVTGRINISSSNPSVIAVSSSSEWVENGSVTIRATAKSAGSAYITVSSADTSDSTTGDSVTVSTGVNLTAKAVVIDTRSSNNYLSSLNVEGYELSPAFDANTNNYTMNVGYDISSINVSGIPADTKSRTVVEGNLDLVAGENNVTVTVTAENGYKRVYTITVTKDKNPDDIDATIQSLVINNATLKNEFKSDVFEYMCDDITADVKSLEFDIQTKIPDLKYEIIGNDELKQGINHITIKVTSRDGSVTKEYEIIVFKTDEVLALEDVIAEPAEPSFIEIIKSMKKELMIGGGILIVVVLFTVFIIIAVKNKSKKEDKELKEDVDKEQIDEEIEDVNKEQIDEEIEDGVEQETTQNNVENTTTIDNDEEKEVEENVEKTKVRKGSLVSEAKKGKYKNQDDDLDENFNIKLDLPSLDNNETNDEE